jgi:AsmA protein
MRALRWAAALLGGAALLAGGAVAALVAAVDSGALTPRIDAAIEAATGRAARLGAVFLRPGLVPRIVVEGASLTNLAGGTQPEMATIRRIEARVAPLPLLRGEVRIRALAVEGADLVLERLADGTPNWVLRAPPREGAPAPAAAPEAPPGPRRVVAVEEILLVDSRVTLPGARAATIEVARARITGIGGGGPVAVAGQVSLAGVAAGLEAETGALPPPPGAPWPYRATLAFGADRVTLEGRLGEPVAIAARIADPAALRPLAALLAPALVLPPALPPIEASLRLGPGSAVSDLLVTLGAMDLGAVVPGLAVARLSARAAALDAPAEAELEATRNGLPFTARLRVDALAALLPGLPERPAALVLDIAAGGASLHAEGSLRQPRRLAGAAFDISARVPDLAALAPLLPSPPAPLTDIAFEGRLTAPDALPGELRLAPFRITAPALQAAGEVTLRPGRPFGIEGEVAAARVDLDALAARPAAPAAAATAAPGPAPPPPAPAPAPEAGRVIPDLPLPVAAARAWQGRLVLSADHLTLGGTDWRALRGTLSVADGVARLTGFAAVTPGGPVRGQGMLDAAQDPPRLALVLRSEGRGLDLAALRRARREAVGIEGRAEVVVDIAGRGATTRAVAASLTGEAGLALVGGRLARAGMLRLGPDLLGLLLPGAPQDGLELRCIALRIAAEDGMARTGALLAETSAGRIEGVAAVNLRTEALAARLLPDVTLLGVRVRAPVGVGGTLAAPRVGVEPGRALGQVMADTVANRLWRDPTVEWLRGRVQGGTPVGDCAAQLRLARMGAEGPVPPPERVVPGVPRELQGTTQDVLRGLGGVGGAIGGALGGILGGARR